MAYSRKVIKKFEETLNNPAANSVGRLDPTAKNVGTGMVGAPACGDVMRLQIEVDEQGKIQIANLAHDNEVLLLRNSNLMFSLASSLMSGGGFGGSGFYELTRTIGIAGKTEKVACEVYSGVKSYASRTKITLPKPVTSENTKFRSKFKYFK